MTAAISLWNPWGAAIVAEFAAPAAVVAGRRWKWKRTENRDWPEGIPALAMARAMVGSTILLHASKRYHRANFDETVDGILETIAPAPGPERLAFLKALGVHMEVQLRGKHHGEGRWTALPSMAFGAIIGRAKLVGIRRNQAYDAARDPWAIPGHVGLLLADVERLVEPITYAGRQGWFDVPDDVLAGAQWKAVGP